jgi:hypothetical protein
VQIASAYEVLADDEKRKLYDQVNDDAVQDSSYLVFVNMCSSLSGPANIVLCLISMVKRDYVQLDQMGVQVGLEGAFLVEGSDSRLVYTSTQASNEAATATSCTLYLTNCSLLSPLHVRSTLCLMFCCAV